jgi:hypothetical protein
MGTNAITFDGPVDLIGSSQQIAQRIRDLCTASSG